MTNTTSFRHFIISLSTLLLCVLSFNSFAAGGPWVGTYVSTTSLMPQELLDQAKKKGEDISSYYPNMVLRRNGKYNMVFFNQIQDKGSYKVRGKQLLTITKNKQTGKKVTDDSAKFINGYKSFSIKMGKQNWTFIRKEE